MPSEKEQFLKTWEQEHATTAKVMAAIPEGKLDFKPHERSKSARELAWHSLWLKHISEMPLFVRSELSNGVQLADMVAYNIYRAFRSGDVSYRYFVRLLPCFWSCATTPPEEIEGLKFFPDDSPLHELRKALGRQRAQNQKVLGSAT